MKLAFVSVFAALSIGSAFPGPAAAQAVAPTPTTRILAIGSVNPGADLTAVRTLLPAEVRETVKLYLDGRLDQGYSLQDRPGVVFILNLTDRVAAQEMLEKLPLGQAHLMTFELMPLAPLSPLRQWVGTPSTAP